MELKPVALVTGASSGIGRAIALNLSHRGYHLILVGRDRNALEETARACETSATIIQQDLFEVGSGLKIFRQTEAKKLKVDIVVNNAGFGVHGLFSETNLEDELAMVQVQISSLLELTKLYLPQMQNRKKGRFLNVASVYSYSAVPEQSVYGASKAFMRSFSYSLASELQPLGISVTLLCPGVTQTEFRKRGGMKEKKKSGLSAEVVAEAGVNGLLKGKAVVIPGGINRFFVFITKLVPGHLMTSLMARINRARGLKR